MKKAIVISLVALLLNSASPFVFAQTLRPASEKDFNAAYDAQIRLLLAKAHPIQRPVRTTDTLLHR